MKATDEMLAAGRLAYMPDLEIKSPHTQNWVNERVGRVVEAVLALVPNESTQAEQAPVIEGLRQELAAEQQRHEVSLAQERAIVDDMNAEIKSFEARLADARAQAEHAEKLLAVYDHTRLEAAMACLESLASFVGANGQTDPHTVEQLDERIRWGIDHNVDVWKKRAEKAEAALDAARAPVAPMFDQADLACIAIDEAVGRQVDREVQQKLADAAVVLLGTRPTDPAPAAAGDDPDAAIVLTPIPDADVVNVLRFLLSAHDACMGDGHRFELETKAMEAFARLEQAVSQ